jgi:hypothetical protein
MAANVALHGTAAAANVASVALPGTKAAAKVASLAGERR